MTADLDVRIYDNTNLAESYSGVVSPLTTSFARDLYEGVYRHFAKFIGVSAEDYRINGNIFPNMIVPIGYHLYYDMRNWYTLISLLPGYTYNKNFFEHMLGISPNAYTMATEKSAKNVMGSVAVSRARLSLQAIKIAMVFAAMPLLVRHFNRRFDRTLHTLMRTNLDAMEYWELRAHYRRIRDDLVRQWRVPIANDFAVMVSVGIARALYRRWSSEDEFATQLTFSARSNLATLDPGRHLLAIKEALENNLTLARSVASSTPAHEVYEEIINSSGCEHIKSLVHEYVERFGSRVPNELKLESPTLNEEPFTIVTMIRALKDSSGDLYTKRIKGQHSRNGASSVNGIVRRGVFNIVLGWARKSIQYREETRLRRTQIFGHARQVFLAIETILIRDGLLAEPGDIMYLTNDEVCDMYNSPISREIIEERMREMQTWKGVRMPTRIESVEPINILEQQICNGTLRNTTKNDTQSLNGFVASRAGRASISGKALVMRDFDEHSDFYDKILVTRHTDPGWTVVFPLVRAIVVERGGILSHASIVAREMGIPCVIGVISATDRISNGASIEIDLISGSITINEI